MVVIGDSNRWKRLLAFASIYLIWGSTYLAIRYGIESFAPYRMMGMRSVIAGSGLYLWGRRQTTERLSPAHWRPGVRHHRVAKDPAAAELDSVLGDEPSRRGNASAPRRFSERRDAAFRRSLSPLARRGFVPHRLRLHRGFRGLYVASPGGDRFQGRDLRFRQPGDRGLSRMARGRGDALRANSSGHGAHGERRGDSGDQQGGEES